MDDRVVRCAPLQSEFRQSFYYQIPRTEIATGDDVSPWAKARIADVDCDCVAMLPRGDLAWNVRGVSWAYFDLRTGVQMPLVGVAGGAPSARVFLAALRAPGLYDSPVRRLLAPTWARDWFRLFSDEVHADGVVRRNEIADFEFVSFRDLIQPRIIRLLSYGRALARDPSLRVSFESLREVAGVIDPDFGTSQQRDKFCPFFYSLPNSIMRPAREDVRFKLQQLAHDRRSILGPDFSARRCA